MHRSTRFLAASLACFALAACASAGGDYPSLAIRDAERVAGTFEVAASETETVAPAPVAANTLERLAQLREEAGSAHRTFMAAVPGARSAVSAARGAEVTENRWAAAQVALADLDSARSQAAIALGDLDLLYADATLAFTDREQISAARSDVVALVSEEDRILAELRGGIAQ